MRPTIHLEMSTFARVLNCFVRFFLFFQGVVTTTCVCGTWGLVNTPWMSSVLNLRLLWAVTASRCLSTEPCSRPAEDCVKRATGSEPWRSILCETSWQSPPSTGTFTPGMSDSCDRSASYALFRSSIRGLLSFPRLHTFFVRPFTVS